jgi:hypothetical protein
LQLLQHLNHRLQATELTDSQHSGFEQDAGMHTVLHPHESLIEDLQPAQQRFNPHLFGQLV